MAECHRRHAESVRYPGVVIDAIRFAKLALVAA
jgi:hypothetical protein